MEKWTVYGTKAPAKVTQFFRLVAQSMKLAHYFFSNAAQSMTDRQHRSHNLPLLGEGNNDSTVITRVTAAWAHLVHFINVKQHQAATDPHPKPESTNGMLSFAPTIASCYITQSESS